VLQIDNLSGERVQSLELFRELATVTGVPAALSGSLNKAPGFAGGYLPAWGWRIDSRLSGRALVGLAGLFKIMATY
jgi:hypothetical protein